ncbi:hypothetical protein RO3G_16759 [Rhizopus delemar RA 99-880]|uniref:Secreted protein n=1 Tax=Rhizopus delemar (strain RA 99-880 / ATCC MYA-4621 / FGSC 9543 / NRRL 43880) TaxID=246409 RepID=I1CUB8_RHIO9|nr:hypothetical protein RO3G_16759 [Rhizopus delemar RA 99-880]|eukprot:EIE92048.1 hypothetical protein RO3G_16759 [Rhizopus delemar RA 99-880]
MYNKGHYLVQGFKLLLLLVSKLSSSGSPTTFDFRGQSFKILLLNTGAPSILGAASASDYPTRRRKGRRIERFPTMK